MSQLENGIRLPSFAEVKIKHIVSVFDELMEDLQDNPAHMVEAFKQLHHHFQSASAMFSSQALLDAVAVRKTGNDVLERRRLLKGPSEEYLHSTEAKQKESFSVTDCTSKYAPEEVHHTSVKSVLSVSVAHKEEPFVSLSSLRSEENTISRSPESKEKAFSAEFPFLCPDSIPFTNDYYACPVDKKRDRVHIDVGKEWNPARYSTFQKDTVYPVKKDGEEDYIPEDVKPRRRRSGRNDLNDGGTRRGTIGTHEPESVSSMLTESDRRRTPSYVSRRCFGLVSNSSRSSSVCNDISQSASVDSGTIVKGSKRYEGFWIIIWPCFGTTSSSFYKAGRRVFVRSGYRFIVDITDEVAKDLHCQPSPTVLFEPDGKEIRRIQHLRAEEHYLLFPSGGFYRRDAVPEALLHTLLISAKRACQC